MSVTSESADHAQLRSDSDEKGDAATTVKFSEIAPLMQLADMMAPVAVRTAATLALADHIAAGTTHLRELAAASDSNPDALRRLLRYLIARGVFAEPETDRYALTDMAGLLLRDHPARLRDRFDLNGPVGRGDLSFIHLLDSIRTGGPSFERMYGQPFWEDLDSDPDRVARFAEMMAANSADSGIESEYEWSEFEHVVDVGGGTGTLVAQVLRANPHMRGTIVDLPATAEGARDVLTRAGLSERCDVVGANFFEPLPSGGDVYVLCKILHDWDDANAVAILRRCAEAAGTAGRVLISEMVLNGGANDRQFTYLDLHMLVYFGGKERTLDEYAQLAAEAGMTTKRVGNGKWGASLLECTPK
ncbi:methyltransferase [Haloactinomyces albus]|uniref:O-methyltransferase n=1 Tax=Haloactinomyces albus TaxID=1352928 RepID=A0AAE4CNF2_9ACTN|nr:methyltransferase [Haloactinomyces albus]MDR7301977.1 hypothetical protein [Haloactinomyces albus]